MLVVGFDLETEWLTPVDPRASKIWEYAAVLWDTQTNMPVSMITDIVWAEDYIFDPRMKIERHHLEDHAIQPMIALDRIRKIFDKADAIVAHNGKDFDKVVLHHEFERHGYKDEPSYLWIDTTVDVPYPPHVETRKLEFLAPVHGFLNPFAHRALFDVLTMLRIASQYSWDKIFERARTPDIYVVAEVKKPWEDNGKSTELAKLRGYRFDKDSKNWYKKIKETELSDEKAQAPFRVGVWNRKEQVK